MVADFNDIAVNEWNEAYQASLKYYKLAYDFSHDYYPGINAATHALLVGDHELKNRLANEVLTICSQLPLDRVDQEWILASEGEACLLLSNIDRAKHFYSHALDRLLPSETGKKDSIAKQVRRIEWATIDEAMTSAMKAIVDDLAVNCSRPK